MQERMTSLGESSRPEKAMARSAEKNRLLIVDDHPLFREGLRQMIDRTVGLMVCGEAADAAAALKAIPALKPDLVLVDISLGGTNGIDLIKSLKAKYEDLPVLVISMHDESLYAERALRAGALGYIMKNAPAKTVKSAIKLMWGKSGKPVSPIEQLSNRELEVFQMLGQGKGTRQIAEELGLTIPTINSFRNRIKEKLELKNSTEMILHAMQWSREQV